MSDADERAGEEAGADESGAEAIVRTMEEIRRAGRNANRTFSGWQLSYTVRKDGGYVRGDMCAIDPADGQKIFSVIGMKRKLGLVAMASEPAPRATRRRHDEALADAAERLVDNVRLPRAARSTRTVVNYAETAASAPRLSDLVLRAAAKAVNPAGATLIELAEAVRHEYFLGGTGDGAELPVGPVAGKAREKEVVRPAALWITGRTSARRIRRTSNRCRRTQQPPPKSAAFLPP